MDQLVANIRSIPAVVWYFVLGAVGGIARLALGIEDETSRKAELARIFCISVPIGGAVGLFIASLTCVKIPFIGECISLEAAAPFVSVLFGVAALNIVRKAAKDGVVSLILPLILLIKTMFNR